MKAETDLLSFVYGLGRSMELKGRKFNKAIFLILIRFRNRILPERPQSFLRYNNIIF